MKLAWFGNPALRKLHVPEAISLEADQDVEEDRCVVYLDSPGALTWFERQLRRESEAKAWLLLSVTPFANHLANHPWLNAFKTQYLQLPLSQPDAIQNALQTLEPPSSDEQDQLRLALYAISWRKLMHDASRSLLAWPQRQPALREQLQRFRDSLPASYTAHALSVDKLLQELEHLSATDVSALIERLGPGRTLNLAAWSSSFGQAALRQRLSSIVNHWQALPEKLQRAKAGLEALSQQESAPIIGRPLADLSLALNGAAIQTLHTALQSLKLSKSYAGSELAILMHNTLEQHVAHILAELDALHIDVKDLRIDTLIEQLDELGPEPVVAQMGVAPVRQSEGPLVVVVIENEPSWQRSILETLAVICNDHGWQDVAFGPDYTVASKQEALDLLKHLKGMRVLAIVDLSIPDRPGEEPRPETGEALLKHLLAAGQNLPLILLTSPTHALAEQRRLLAYGFNDVDFVFKLRLDHLYERLEENLNQQLAANFHHRFDLDPRLQIVRIDKIELALGKVGYALLQALARAHQRGSRALSQSELLEMDADLREALAEQQDPAGFSKSLYQLRREILKAFAQAERFISLSELISTVQAANGAKGFRIPPQNEVLIRGDHEDIIEEDRPAQAESPPLKLRLLIVEDERIWSQEILNLAESMGFECRTAASISEADTQSQSFLPDLVSLDLQLPRNSGGEGIDTGGFEVLQKLRRLNPAIRTVIPSTLYRDPALITQSSRLGVPLADFVPKGASYQDVSWLIHLYNRLRHHRLELQAYADQADTRELLPLMNLRPLSDTEGGVQIEVNGRIWHGDTLEARLLGALSHSAGQWMLFDTLYAALYPGAELESYQRHENFEQALKRARDVITRDWLGGKVSARLGILLLERQGQRFCLHANRI